MLFDCGVVRASIDHEGLREIYDDGDAGFRPVAGRDDVVDYFLTEAGRALARVQLKEAA